MRTIRLFKWFVLLGCGLSLGLAARPQAVRNDDAFTLGQITVRPGESASGFLEVRDEDGFETAIPLTVIHGAGKGKTLALVAGVHGYEYPPVLALYRLKEMIDPKGLSGTIVLVHIANLPSFQKRTIYYSPVDWKNLNRVFPGSPDGTLSQRIAYRLTEDVIRKCDYLVDLHCGDGNEALIPYSYWMVSGRRELDDVTKQMAVAFGIGHIIIDETRSRDITDSKYLGNTAILLGKPAITTESGYLGRTDEESIRRNVDGVMNLLRHFDMTSGPPPPKREPIWIDRYEVVYSNTDGLFFPQTEMGFYVSKGQLIGYTTDYLGRRQEELRAPFSGIILYIINTPPTSRGEPLFEVGRVKSEE